MEDVSMDDIYTFVARTLRLNPTKIGKPAPLLTDSDRVLYSVHERYDAAVQSLDPRKATNSQEWHHMCKKLKAEYVPHYQAWSDRHELGFNFY